MRQKIFFILFCLFLFIALLSIKLKAEGLSVFFDLKPLFLSIDAGGLGLGVGFELNLKSGFSIYSKFVYMNFYDVSIWLIYWLQGFRYYFDNAKFDKFYLGLHFLTLYGSKNNEESMNIGFQIEIGYKWYIEGLELIFIEPQLSYIYIFGELPLPGVNVGLNFGITL